MTKEHSMSVDHALIVSIFYKLKGAVKMVAAITTEKIQK